MSEFSVYRPISVIMICIGLIVLGIISLTKTPMQMMPSIETNEVKILTSLKGASAEEVELQITAPLERAISTLPGLLTTRSISLREQSEIILNFKPNVVLLEALSLLRDKVDSTNLPEGSTRPRIQKNKSSSVPAIQIAIRPIGEKNISQIAPILKNDFFRKVESIPGVALSTLIGEPNEIVEIDLDPNALLYFGLSSAKVLQQIQTYNQSFSGGEISSMGQKISVRIGNNIKDIQELSSLIILRENERFLRLGDISRINIKQTPAERPVRLSGTNALLVEIMKEHEANAPAVTSEIQKKWHEFKEKNKDQLDGEILFDQGVEITKAIDGVIGAVIGGGLLTALAIFIFMNSIWSTITISLTIPIALMLTLILMFFTGITYNLLSLAGLALGVGMLVDNAILVLENIRFYQSQLDDPREAAVLGTQKVSGAVVASTLSNISVFGPLIFVEGVIGDLFRDISLTIVYSNIAALFVALLLVPMMCSLNPGKIISPKDISNKQKKFRLLHHSQNTSAWKNILSAFLYSVNVGWSLGLWLCRQALLYLARPIKLLLDKFLGLIDPLQGLMNRQVTKLEHYISKKIPDWLKRPMLMITMIFTLTFVATLVFRFLGSDLFPDTGATRFTYSLDYPQGQVTAATEMKLRQVEIEISKIQGIQTFLIQLASRGSNTADLIVLTGEDEGPNINNKILNLLSTWPEIEFKRVKESLVSSSKPIEVVVYHDDLNKLKTFSDQIQNDLNNISGLVDIETSVKPPISEIQIQLSKKQIDTLGIDINNYLTDLKSLMNDWRGPAMVWNGQDLPIQISNSASYFSSLNNLKYFYQKSDDKKIYLEQLAQITPLDVVSRIDRLDRQRVARVSANLNNIDLNTAENKIRSSLEKNQNLSKVNWIVGGQSQEKNKSEKSLVIAILLSILLIYLILASQFESLIQPLLILLAVPLSIVGVAFLLWISGMTVSTMVLVGFIILVGTTVNTSIVIVDSANQMTLAGIDPKLAVTRAAAQRMRPILMSSGASIIGLLPLAFKLSEGSASQQPLAITIIGGLLSSTVLSLILIPILYIKMSKVPHASK